MLPFSLDFKTELSIEECQDRLKDTQWRLLQDVMLYNDHSFSIARQRRLSSWLRFGGFGHYRIIMTKNKLYLIVLTSLITMSSLFINTPAKSTVHAQTSVEKLTGTLIYSRRLTSEEIQIISLSAETQYQLTIPEDYCYQLIGDSEFVMVVAEQTPDLLTIYRLDGISMLEVSWNNEWISPCFVSWRLVDAILEIPDSCVLESAESERFTFFSLNILSGEITGPHTKSVGSCDEELGLLPPGFHAIEAWELPGFVSDETTLIISPNSTVILYSRCISREVSWNGWYDTQQCSGPSETVIYDLIQRKTIEVLRDGPDLSKDHLRGGIVWGIYRFAWSPTGRYLAYEVDSHPRTVHVYDVMSHQYWEPIVISDDYDFLHENVWSPDEQKLAFWLSTASSQESAYDEVTVMVFDWEANTLATTGWVGRFVSFPLRWSPDSRSLIFMTAEGLMLWDIESGDIALLDDSVISILDWIPPGRSMSTPKT